MPLNDDLKLSAYNYHLPEESIAQHPVEQRAKSRLMVLGPTGDPHHAEFEDLPDWLRPGDLLVRNNTRVFPARLTGQKETGGRVEMLLLEYPGQATDTGGGWWSAQVTTLIKSSKRPRPGTLLHFCKDIQAKVLEIGDNGKVEVEFRFHIGRGGALDELLERHGTIPLPPYIKRPEGTSREDRERYQTLYAGPIGSVAAPTAGLHFDDNLLAKLKEKGVESCAVTLHVGFGTFAPVRCDNITEHQLHKEQVEITPETAEKINRAREKNNRIWAVGTTTVRSLEFAADKNGLVRPVREPCGLFIYPGFQFRVVDNLITNFHLPKSSLLFLVSALIGRKRLLASYREAVDRGYRFFSYGDAMAVIRRE